MKEIQLRGYQEECINKIAELEGGSHLVVCATGLGKTVIFSHIKRKGRMLILSHRDELVHQPLKYFDCLCGVEQAKEHSEGNEEVVSASVPSLVRRLDKFSPNDFDIIITDEAHHAAAPSYRKIYDYFNPRLHIGFTATPKRGDNVKLDDIFEDIIFEKNLKWGIKNKFLTDINCLQVDIGYDLSKCRRRMGDYEMSDLEEAVNKEAMNKGVAEAYRQLAVGQTLIFATSVSHAWALAKEIEGAVVVSGETAREERAEIIRKFTNREIPCIINCMVFTEGTDMPLVETVIIARPTTNSSLYTQMVGRGLRLSEGKKFLTLIDCVGVTGKVKLCTAPSLFGIDMGVVPERSRHKVTGLITEMEAKVERLADTPEAWILNTKEIDLFAAENNYDLHNINWKKAYDGSLVCSLADGYALKLTAENDLGKTDIYYIQPKTNPYLIRPQVPMQTALDMSFQYLTTKHFASEKLWNMNYVNQWGDKPATDSQIKYINTLAKKKVNKERYDRDALDHLKEMKMNKFEASIVIDRLLR